MRLLPFPARRQAILPLLGLALVLAACTGGGGVEPGVSAAEPATAPAAGPVSEPAEAPDEPAGTLPPAAAAAGDEAAPPPTRAVTILTEDDRSSRLRSVTAGWDTDWNRHTIAYDELLSGGPPRDGIPPIDDPVFISQDEAAEWLAGNEPVIALERNGDARAYPLQILTWHEIVNDTVGGDPVVVTFCPLCNSAIVFERVVDGEVTTFGTSGLLRFSDLVMWDRATESLWQQFTGEGIVGTHAGRQLAFLPSALVSFDDFREAYPDGLVLSRQTGHNRAYGQNPYVGYDTIGQSPFLFTGPTDGRLPAMARVITVYFEAQDVAVAYPLETLASAGVINDRQVGLDLVVFHAPGTASALGARTIAEAADVGATGVFSPMVDGERLTFKADDGVFQDEETGTTWNVLGLGVDGPLAGRALEPIVHADHFWFSWAAFRPDTIIYQP